MSPVRCRARRVLACCALALLAVAGTSRAETPRPGRVPVASVGPEIIYLDDIAVRKALGDLGPLDETQVRQLEIDSLRHRIRHAVIDQEVAVRRITIPEDLVALRARAMRERSWRMLGPTDEAREGALEADRVWAAKTQEALRLWREDPDNGDAFAARELEPLGVSKAEWRWLTSQSNNAAFLKGLEEQRTLDRRGYLQVPPQELVHARRGLEVDGLKRAVVPGVTASSEETSRLLDLVQGTDWIDLVTATGPRERLQALRSRLGGDAGAALQEATRLGIPRVRTDRLTGAGLWPAGVDSEPDVNACLLAIHATATAAGTASRVFESAGPDGPRVWLLYVAGRQTRKGASAWPTAMTERARAALERVKRDQRFELWLWRRMRERATFHEPRFSRILEPGDGS